MTPVSHTSKALDLLPRERRLILAELAWRWGFYLCSGAAFWALHLFAASNPSRDARLWSEPSEAGALFGGFAMPSALALWAAAAAFLAVAWVLLSSIGRCVVLRRIFALSPRSSVVGGCRRSSILTLQSLQILFLLLPFGVGRLALWLQRALLVSNVSAARAGTMVLSFLCLSLLAMGLWSFGNFLISLAQIELARGGDGLLPACRRVAVAAVERRSALLREASLSLSLRAICLLSFGVLALLSISAFIDEAPLTAVLMGLVFGVLQLLVGDFLLLVRLYSSAAILIEAP